MLGHSHFIPKHTHGMFLMLIFLFPALHTPPLASCCPPPCCLPPCSKLWGCKGELADAPGSLGAQRLLDWSYAGYMAGEMPIPRGPLVGSVADFGAVGDGVADDTKVIILWHECCAHAWR